MKKHFLVCVALLVSLSAGAAEPWKGSGDSSDFSLGALTGLGIVGTSAGYAVLGTASKKIVREGFVPGIDNSVSIEVELGPLFTHGTSTEYSAHLRWDFAYDDQWTLYTAIGLGGQITSDELGDEFLLYPRIAAGALWRVSPVVSIRAEVSHELIAVGVNFPL